MNCRRGLPVPSTTNGVPFSKSTREQPERAAEMVRTLGEVALVDEPRDDVRAFEVTVGCV